MLLDKEMQQELTRILDTIQDMLIDLGGTHPDDLISDIRIIRSRVLGLIHFVGENSFCITKSNIDKSRKQKEGIK